MVLSWISPEILSARFSKGILANPTTVEYVLPPTLTTTKSNVTIRPCHVVKHSTKLGPPLSPTDQNQLPTTEHSEHAALGNEHQPATSKRYVLTSAALAFVIWGGWAWFVNSQPPATEGRAAVVSGLVQGIGSCMITLLMVRSVTWLFRRLAGHPLRLLLPAAVTTAVTGTCLALAHVIAGTANVALTIAPGLVVAFCFNVFTANKLRLNGLQREKT